MLIMLCSCSKDDNSNLLDDTSEDVALDEQEVVEVPIKTAVDHYSSELERASLEFDYNSDDYIIIINTTEQMMYVVKDNTQIAEYTVSTGKTGEGNRAGSGQTPLGFHKIVEKIGDGATLGTIFVGKKNTGKLTMIYTDETDVDNDPVVTRILSLDGLERGYNKGGNVDSFNRFIYIHGTHEEGLLGTKTSHGCIRMKNTEVIELFNIVPNHTMVYITK